MKRARGSYRLVGQTIASVIACFWFGLLIGLNIGQITKAHQSASGGAISGAAIALIAECLVATLVMIVRWPK